ncbi:pyrroline-5-carboxylate reductase family protein [Oryzicola mucosus]|uniref:Pyrroline-5-carboxylate reductase n=1 Tax=Oryzicola mucosus TaxID=2767425 RepID=A0A8J6PQL5_9HYPH|nr:pyrroline-5-carboxylate reductase dimerization domain-containing protein [Oryzicola mucosus]MBD0416992.1 NAD(P)-binding domain-containing protein [Oryzicola mucosus]
MDGSAVVGIVGGAGWLGSAIATRGLSAGVLSSKSLLIISSRSPRGNRFANWPEIVWTADNEELSRRADIVVLSVRPHQFRDISLNLEGRLVISVMAGISLETLKRRLNADRIVRAMPNAAAEIGRSYSPWVATGNVTASDRLFVSSLMAACGEEDEVGMEAHLDYLTGLSGSGPAFPALLASSMLSHAETAGIPSHVAEKAVRGVVCGASRLIDSDEFMPNSTVESFLNYRGTTAAALHEMIRAGFSDAVHAGLRAAALSVADMTASADKPAG